MKWKVFHTKCGFQLSRSQLKLKYVFHGKTVKHTIWMSARHSKLNKLVWEVPNSLYLF